MPVEFNGGDKRFRGWRRLVAVLAILAATTTLALNGIIEGQAVVALLGALIPVGWSASRRETLAGLRYVPEQTQTFHAGQPPPPPETTTPDGR